MSGTENVRVDGTKHIIGVQKDGEPVQCICGASPRLMNLYTQEHLTNMFCVECACGLRGPLELCEEDATPAWSKMQRALKHHDALVEVREAVLAYKALYDKLPSEDVRGAASTAKHEMFEKAEAADVR